jgi:trehalose 6-phosphate synthase/phosphatase
MAGKKNVEVLHIAVNKGEIVRRLLYKNPDAEFVFCAGDDKACPLFFACHWRLRPPQTDEHMFRALTLFPTTGTTKAILDAPLSVTLIDANSEHAPPVELAITPECVFTTAVGQKKTLANWHVTTPQEIVEHMLGLVGGEVPQSHL